MKKNKNGNLHKAKAAKNDEFYTQLSDIEKECAHYADFFKGKVVYCNCDDARDSNFFRYFTINFEHLGLKKVIATGYKKDGRGVCLVYEGDLNGNRRVDDEEITVTELQGDGDFRSEECEAFLREADVVVTNPPFSLFREYVAQLMEFGKKFLIIGNKNIITYKEIFPYIKENKMWVGYKTMSGSLWFETPEGYENEHDEIKGGKKVTPVACCWFTNIPHDKRTQPLTLYKKYNPQEFPKYDNYDAIEVSKTADIPMDYDGVMGVPISFLDKYCPEQFEIVNANDYRTPDNKREREVANNPFINGKEVFKRILIRKLRGHGVKTNR